MKKIVFLLFSVLLLYNCTSNTIYKAPEDLIPKDSMAMLIQEMIIASAAKNVKNIHQQRKIDYMPFLYDRFQIDSARFKKSSLYYTSRIDDYGEILKQVRVELNKLKDSLVIVKHTQDSILKDSIDLIRYPDRIKKTVKEMKIK